MIDVTTDIAACSLADFGESFTWTPSGGSPTTITGIWDEPSRNIDLSMGPIGSTAPQLTVRTADVAGITKQDTIRRVSTGTDYKMTENNPDGTGFTVLILAKAAS